MNPSPEFLAEFTARAAYYLGRAQGGLASLGPGEFDEPAVFASFSALRSLAGGACFLGCDQLHRLARAAELAIHAILAHRPPGTPACRQIMARTLTRLEELIVELSQGRQPEGGDETLLSQLDAVIANAPLAASDYRPSTAAVDVPAQPEIEVEPPPQDRPVRPAPALESRFGCDGMEVEPVLARLFAVEVGELGAVTRVIRELREKADQQDWPAKALAKLESLEHLAEQLAQGRAKDVIEAFSQFYTWGRELQKLADHTREHLAHEPTGSAGGRDATATIAKADLDLVVKGAAMAAGAPQAGNGGAVQDFCAQADDLLHAVEKVVLKQEELTAEQIAEMTRTFQTLAQTAAHIGLPWVEALAKRISDTWEARCRGQGNSPFSLRIQIMASIDSLRMLIDETRTQSGIFKIVDGTPR